MMIVLVDLYHDDNTQSLAFDFKCEMGMLGCDEDDHFIRC